MRAASPELLDEVTSEARRRVGEGRCAAYIPALAGADPSLAGLALVERGESGDPREFASGDADARFTMQSVSKAFALACALETRGAEAVFSRVGVEPSGDAFNSIVRLETSARRKPFNPMINAGAIATTSLLPGEDAQARVRLLARFIGSMTGEEPRVDDGVYRSERDTAARNRSIAWMLKELGLLDGDVEEALDAYFMQCALRTSARELARAGACFAFDGERADGVRVMRPESARVTKALMCLCGLYDGSGAFAVAAGVPAKSGVGGGIMAASRGRAGIGAFGPALDAQGNSVFGTRALSALAERLDLFSY
jgi:glutaminase